MDENSKRMEQTRIIATEERTLTVDKASDSEDEDDGDGLLPNVDIDAKVYAYCEVASTPIASDAYPKFDPTVHGRPVYVGQTTQELKDRDRQHLNTSYTKFDRQYTKRSQYVHA